MTSKDISIVHQFVDENIEELKQNDLMRLPHPNMPLEMRDETKEAHSDWMPWRAIVSTVSDSEVTELESKINLRYPVLYIEFLRYKHFLELLPVAEITFFEHSVSAWKQVLLDHYYKSWLPEKLIKQGYLYFADYSDWGIVCFDTNEQTQEDGDCPIIMIDHEALYDNPVPKESLYPSFVVMMQSLLETQQNPQPE